MKNKKAKLRSQADKAWFHKLIQYQCEFCSQKAVQVHHIYPKGSFGYLRYNLDNGVAVCQNCHMDFHFRYNPDKVPQLIKIRGQEWYDRLKKKALTKPKPGYMTTQWYEDNIKKLEQ